MAQEEPICDQNKSPLRDAYIRYLAARGIEVGCMSSDEWLALAIEAGEMKKSLGPFDPAFPHFAEIEKQFLMAAELRQNQP